MNRTKWQQFVQFMNAIGWLLVACALCLTGLFMSFTQGSKDYEAKLAEPVAHQQLPANICWMDGQPVIYKVEIQATNRYVFTYLNQAGQVVMQMFLRTSRTAAWELHSEAVIDGSVCLNGSLQDGDG